MYILETIIVHEKYNRSINDNDVAILRSANTIVYGTLVQPGYIAGSSYYLADNQLVWAVGWGTTSVSTLDLPFGYLLLLTSKTLSTTTSTFSSCLPNEA